MIEWMELFHWTADRMLSFPSSRTPKGRGDELDQAQYGCFYLYLLNWKSPVLGGLLRTPHTICIPFAFANVDIASGITGTGADRYKLQDEMAGAWVAFAKTGNPNHAAIPTGSRIR